METKFNFKSQICTGREQSERLLALGLKIETADCYFFYCDIAKEWKRTILSSTQVFKDYPTTVIPAWSLHRLLCLYGLDYTIKEVYNNTEECYGMLISAIGIAIEDGDFPKEYLK